MMSRTVSRGRPRRRAISLIDSPQILCMDRMKQTCASSRVARPLWEPGRDSLLGLDSGGDEGEGSEGKAKGDQVDTSWDTVANDCSDGEADKSKDPEDEIKRVHAPWIPHTVVDRNVLPLLR